MAQAVDWSDFRDHIATAEKDGRRKWIYPRKVGGKFFRWRTWFSWLLLAIMFAGPFITIQGNPLLMMNIPERKFVVLGQIFWPQDMIIFAIAVLVLFTSIVIFTAAFGRVWCGWACPQTVMMEMVFRKIEYFIEGDAHQQRALNQEAWNVNKIFRKLSKHAIFYALSFLVGNVLLSYIIGWQQLYQIITDPPALHLVGLSFMIAFSLLFYGIFARFREQACTFICPYGRFQSVLLDENSIVVAYDHKRGETRAPLKHGLNFLERRQAGNGDCIACNQCVAVCPTGIDIRNGSQMDCIQCGLCIDACDTVMKKIGRETRLIGYDNDINIHRRQAGQPPVYRFVRSRTVVYSAMIAAVGAVMLYAMLTRSLLDVNVLHDRNPVAVRLSDGSIRNAYTVRLLNKRGFDRVIAIDIDGPKNATVHVIGTDSITPDRPMIILARDTTTELRVLVTAPAEDNPEKSIPVKFRITDIGLGEAASETDNFVSP